MKEKMIRKKYEHGKNSNKLKQIKNQIERRKQ